jgi:phosphoribosylaminoimidazole carboxylase PurE protein
MGSDSDWDAMSRCHALLEEFGVASEVFVASAHRTPQKVHRLAESCEQGDVQVVIAAAGMANHLAGTMAALVSCPVIGVPMKGGTMDGMDALLSTAQMPPGVPVATVAVGSAGARNAAVLAAQILSVIAGKDPDDPRQPETVPIDEYADALEGEADGLSVGVLEEGFDRPEHEEAMNTNVRTALDELADAGATIEEVSLPMHAHAMDIYTVALAEGFVAAVAGEGVGHNWRGWYNTSWVDSFGKARRAQGGDFPPSVKLTLLTGAYTSDQYHSKYYAEAMNLRAELTEKYDELFAEYDVVAMPTTPMTANEYVPDQDRFEFIADAWGNLANTAAFNMTGHPSLSVPVEPHDGLPVGLMMTGSQFNDATVLDAGFALESILSDR